MTPEGARSLGDERHERLAYFTEIVPSHGIHYTEVATYESVRKLSKKLGIID
jgi:hypothetical protein